MKCFQIFVLLPELLLAFVHGLFQGLALGDIHQDAPITNGLPIAQHGIGINHDRKNGSVLTEGTIFMDGRFTFENFGTVFDQAPMVLGNDTVQRVLGCILKFVIVSKHCVRGTVAESEIGYQVHFKYGFRQHFRQLAEAFLRLKKCFFGRLPLRNLFRELEVGLSELTGPIIHQLF